MSSEPVASAVPAASPIQLLGRGTTVNAAAHAVGYRRPSAFISAFRRVTGQTPGTYLRAGTIPPTALP